MAFILHHKVTKDEIDELNHVNNIVYLKWINKVSGNHWKKLSNNDMNTKFVWVVVRHEIDYKTTSIVR